jgi:hypothetical protein
MSNRISAESRPATLPLAIALAAALSVCLSVQEAIAQTGAWTLATPKGAPKLTQPAPAQAPPRIRQSTFCGVYGEGFVLVPGTDTCVKTGGYVRSDVGINLGR